jgi:ADP-dependent NAD(P)H-hydrate dehydratase / NAD(P)H-hydrate epimerase
MLAVVGTVPDEEFPLLVGEVRLDHDRLWIENRSIPVNRGTPALLAAACIVLEFLGMDAPVGFLAGDTGLGGGSRLVYDHLIGHIGATNFKTFVFHYLQPDVDRHNLVLFAFDRCTRRPTLIADAGFMYAAKMSGEAPAYDLFTPDVGELAFLADENAPHPSYTRGFILHEENRVTELIERAYEYNNAARHLLVKGRQDFVADRTGILSIIERPSEEAMEAMGGTGDTLTGLVAALAASGLEIPRASVIAALTNRLAGHLASPTPATQIMELVRFLPAALEEILLGEDKGGGGQQG